MSAAKKIILLLWLVIVASLGNASALTPGTTEIRVGEKTLATVETRQAEPLETVGGYQENGRAAYDVAPDSLLAAETTALREGSFSVVDWGSLPEHLRPTGPLTLLETGSDELLAAQQAKAAANDALRGSLDLRGVPMDIHEIQPVKFGGSPTDLANKTLLPRDFHQQVVTPFWNQLQRDIGPYVTPP